MKRFLATLSFLLSLVLTAPSFAGEWSGIYLAPKLLMMLQNTGNVESSYRGSSFSGSSSQFTFGGALAVGCDFYRRSQLPIRAEVEYAFRGNNEKSSSSMLGRIKNNVKGRLNSQTLLANAYLDFHNSTLFTPYIGGGLGFAFNKLKVEASSSAPSFYGSTSKTETSTEFAWQLGGGVAWAATDKLAIDLGYRYISLGHKEMDYSGSKIEMNPYSHELALGLRWTF